MCKEKEKQNIYISAFIFNFVRIGPPKCISTPCFFLLLENRHLNSFLLAPSSEQRRQLDNPPSQVKTLNLATPGGSRYNNLVSHFSDLSNHLLYIIRLFTNPFCFLPLRLVFPVPVPDYFDNKNRKTFPSSVLCMWVKSIPKMT
ncbi:hypothetical protein ILYODFUR_034638 [Ilyodon furcidens]|uniref:Uncharacterized protein n=1 Tax=Ilyodon furcidens TaxID=33524 RepID=A0ABV0VJK4_9TELE